MTGTILLAVAATAATNGWPLVAVRLTGHIEQTPELLARQIEVHAQNRGSCDEYWFGSDACGAKLSVAAGRLGNVAKWRPLLDQAGILLSYQQGVTLGHGYPLVTDDPNAIVAASAYSRADFNEFPSDNWMVDEEERHLLEQRMCPRSPAARDYLYRYVKLAVEKMRPASYWLDDDLRLGFCTLQGCFCERCIRDFNAANGTAFTRPQLIAALTKGALHDPLRVKWSDFNQESLAGFAAQARRAVDEAMPECRLCLQMVRADKTWSGRNWRRVYEALAGERRRPVGVRVGSDLCYNEADPGLFVWRTFRMAEEAERTKDYDGLVGTICYEQETYPRRALHKSPGAIVTECTLALGSGADTLSLYFYDGRNPEPLAEYGRFAKTVARARPYFERLSEVSRRTRLAGIARVVGRHAVERRGFCTSDDTDVRLSRFNLPVTVGAAKPSAWYLSERSVEDLDADEVAGLLRGGLVATPDVWKRFMERFGREVRSVYPLADRLSETYRQARTRAAVADVSVEGKVTWSDLPVETGVPRKQALSGAVVAKTPDGGRVAIVNALSGTTSDYPLFAQRRALLDVLDRVTPGGAAVRVEEARMIHQMVRRDAADRTVAATFLNCSLGSTDALTVRIRRPAGKTAVWMGPDGRETSLSSVLSADGSELTVAHPGLAPWSVGTIFIQ